MPGIWKSSIPTGIGSRLQFVKVKNLVKKVKNRLLGATKI